MKKDRITPLIVILLILPIPFGLIMGFAVHPLFFAFCLPILLFL